MIGKPLSPFSRSVKSVPLVWGRAEEEDCHLQQGDHSEVKGSVGDMRRAKLRLWRQRWRGRARVGRKDGLGNQSFGLRYKKGRKAGVDFKFLVQVLGK